MNAEVCGMAIPALHAASLTARCETESYIMMPTFLPQIEDQSNNNRIEGICQVKIAFMG